MSRHPAGTRWAGPEDVVAALRARHAKGEFLGRLARGEPVTPLVVSLRPPTVGELADRLGEVQEWADGWRRRAPSLGLRIEQKEIGGRRVGVNAVPSQVWVDDAGTLWRLLGARAEVAALQRARGLTEQLMPQLLTWTAGHPREVVEHADHWAAVLGAVRWIQEHAGETVYLRQIDVPGVDTKFVERHASLVAALLDLVLPAERIDASVPRPRLAARYGLAVKPAYVRMRRLDGTSLLPVGGPAELALRVDDAAATALAGGTVLVVENEVTYLALPPLPDAIAVYGEGYAASRIAPLTWLSEREVRYWGDIDTHGFAILDAVRGVLPGVRSVLMDRETLLRHEVHWSSESAVRSGPLERLTAFERALYADLVEGTYGSGVRLEQERIPIACLTEVVSGRE